MRAKSWLVTATELTVLGALPLLLYSVQHGFPGLHDALIFNHARFRGYTLITSAYVHHSENHLLNNLFGYGRIALFPYIFCRLSGHRQWFRRTMVALLLVLPVLSGLTNYFVLPHLYPEVIPLSAGFSSIVAGFVAFLCVALGRYLWTEYDGLVAGTATAIGGFCLVALLEVRWYGTVRPIVGGVVGLGFLTVVGWYLQQRAFSVGLGPQPGLRLFEGVVIAMGWVVLGSLIWDLLPVLPTPDPTGMRVNPIGHAAGLIWGTVLAAGTAQLPEQPTVSHSSTRTERHH